VRPDEDPVNLPCSHPAGVPPPQPCAILPADLPAKRSSEPVSVPSTTWAAQRPPLPATQELALTIARFLDQKLATDIAVLDVSGPLVITDYFVIATVRSARQGLAIARELDASMKHQGHRRRNPSNLDGDEPTWVLRDYDDVVVHLFQAEARAFYDLESLWADAPRVPFTAEPRATEAPVAHVERRHSAFRILPGMEEDRDG
jgi:ribosome-associated protein